MICSDDDDCNDFDVPDAFHDDDSLEPEPCQLDEPALFPVADDEDLLEVGDENENMDASMYEEALESSKDLQFEPKYQQLLCTVCDMVISSVTDYLDHQKMVHGRSMVYCPLCVVFFSVHSQLSQHWRDIHSRDFRANKVEPRNMVLMKVYANIGLKKDPVWTCGVCKDLTFNSIFQFRYFIFTS